MDARLFTLIHGFAVAAAQDGIFVFLASGLIWAMGAALIIFLLVRRAQRLIPTLSALGAALVAWSVNQVIGEIHFRVRPFVELAGVRPLIEVSPLMKSFPSDHAVIAWALAVSVFLWNRRWGGALIVAAALIALGRVLVGVHYPSDVAAGAAIGAAVAVVVHYAIHRSLPLRYRR